MEFKRCICAGIAAPKHPAGRCPYNAAINVSKSSWLLGPEIATSVTEPPRRLRIRASGVTYSSASVRARSIMLDVILMRVLTREDRR